MIFKEWIMNEARKQDVFFNYTELTNDKWYEILRSAKKQFKVNFDTENDDKKVQRTIVIDQDYWEDTTCKFACELRFACGDWECPIAYFRCQIVDGYADGLSKYGKSMFCYIPIEGNDHLVKNKNGWSAPDSDCKERPNERKCWNSLKNYLTNLVNKEIKKVQSSSK